jgi:hypothetical protein
MGTKQRPITLDDGARAIAHARALVKRVSTTRVAWGVLLHRVRDDRRIRTHALARGPQIARAIDALFEHWVCAECLGRHAELTDIQTADLLTELARLQAIEAHAMCDTCARVTVVYRLA